MGLMRALGSVFLELGYYRMVKVLQVISSLNPGGGAEQSLVSMAPWISSNHELNVVSIKPDPGLGERLTEVGIPVHYLSSFSWRGQLNELKELLEELSPDLVHSVLVDADILSALAVRSRETALVLSIVNVDHGWRGIAGRRFQAPKYLLVWVVHAWAARRATRLHVLSVDTATVMRRRLRVRTDRIDVIPRGRNPFELGTRSEERRENVRRSLGVPDRAPLIVATARHEVQKGLDVLLRAFQLIMQAEPHCQLLIGGRSGPETEKLIALASESPSSLSIRFIGQRNDVADLMCAADVWCVPSRWEGFGGILIEAMALEVPVVASDIPPIREVMGTDEIFNLADPDNPEALAKAVLQTIQSEDGCRRRTSLGRWRFLQHFTMERVAREMLAFYDRSLSQTR